MYRNNYLIGYDISCSKTRNKVFKRLSEEGFSVQLSVFLLHVSTEQLHKVWTEALKLIDVEEDRLFCVTLNRQGFCEASQPQEKSLVMYHDCPIVTKLVS